MLSVIRQCDDCSHARVRAPLGFRYTSRRNQVYMCHLRQMPNHDLCQSKGVISKLTTIMALGLKGLE